MKNKVSLKVSAISALAAVVSTASVVSLVSNANSNIAVKDSNSTDTSISEQTSRVSTNSTNVSVTDGIKTKIVDRNVSRQNPGYITTTLQVKYQYLNFGYPGYNRDYSNALYRYLYSHGSYVDLSAEIANERVSYTTSGNPARYNDIDYIGRMIEGGTLLKHPAADGLHKKSISKDIKAVRKQFSVNTNKKGTVSLGLFAAPGEVVTLSFDDATFESLKRTQFKGLEFIINDNNYEDYTQSGSIPNITTRYPYTKTIFEVDPNSKTIKIGSPFGGPISLNIKSELKDQNVDYVQSDSNWINFEATGALEQLEYIHGQTTEKDWNEQISRVKTGMITAPAASIVYSYGSATIPYTDDTVIGGISVDKVKYPAQVVNKWKDLGFLGSYFGRRDVNPSLSDTRLSLGFSQNSYWGGSVSTRKSTHGLYASIDLGGKAFLSGLDGFSSDLSSDLFLELGYQYLEKNASFGTANLDKAKQAVSPLLIALLDTGRNRNSYKYKSDTSFPTDSYNNIQKMTKKSLDPLTSIHRAVIYTVGYESYINYIRYAVENNPTYSKDWRPMVEVQKMSDYFGINLYQAFINNGTSWTGDIPQTYWSASTADRKIIDYLQKTYYSTDFVGNMYSSSTNIFNKTTGKLVKTSDNTAPFEIQAGVDYTFDFAKYINSTNPYFSWSDFKVASTSQAGVKLEVNKKNRTVTYKASEKFASDDIITLTIYPKIKTGNPVNYVPFYSWDIKLRQVVNTPTVKIYDKFNKQSTDPLYYLRQMLENDKLTPSNIEFANLENKGTYFSSSGQKQGARFQFKFIAPETARYQFSNTWSDAIMINANGRTVYRDWEVSSGYKNTTVANLNKGQSLTFDIAVMNMDGKSSEFDMKVQDLWRPSKSLDFWSNVTVNNIHDVQKISGISSLVEFTQNQKYVYKPRTINYFSVNSNAAYKMNSTEYQYSAVDTSKYTLQSDQYQSTINKLKDQKTNFEVWNEMYGPGKARVQFTVEFKENTTLNSVMFTHRLDNHLNARPTNIKIINLDNYNVLYDGVYGAEFNERSTDRTGINFTKKFYGKKLLFVIDNHNQSGIILRKMYLSGNSYRPTDSLSLHNSVSYKSSIK